MSETATATIERLPDAGPFRSTPAVAFGAMLLRDITVLRKEFVQFLARTVMQPLLFVFVFAYVFPKIGQGVGGAAGAAAFSSILVPGVVAIACIFQGIQAVALPLVQDFGYSREIEDRVMAPLPVWSVAVEKVAAGALQHRRLAIDDQHPEPGLRDHARVVAGSAGDVEDGSAFSVAEVSKERPRHARAGLVLRRRG